MASRRRPGGERPRPGKKRNDLWEKYTSPPDDDDPARSSWKCKCCNEKKTGALRRLVAHIGRIPGEEIELCDHAPPEAVRDMRVRFFTEYGGNSSPPELNGAPVFLANARYTNVNGEIVKTVMRSRPNQSSSGSGINFSASNDWTADAQNREMLHGAGAAPIQNTSGSGSGGMQAGMSSAPARGSLQAAWQTQSYAEADVAVRRFFYGTSQPFNLVNSPFWKDMVSAVGRAGPGYASVSPKFEAIRVRHLNEEYEDLQTRLQFVRDGWRKFGVTIVTDGWQCSRRRSIVNFIAVSIHGAIFLKSFDALEVKKTGAWLWGKLRPILLEVGVKNVVQVVTENGSNFVTMGNLMRDEFPTIIHGRCVCHCLNLLLKDISELDWVQPEISDCLRIVGFMLKKPSLVAAFRKIAPRDLIKPAATRFAYTFLLMSELCEPDMRRALQQFVTSDVWFDKWERLPKAQKVKEIVQSRGFWDDCCEILVIMEPILKVLRLADREGATMGLIFEEMDRAQENITTLTQQHVIAREKIDAVRHLIFELSEEERGLENRDLVSRDRWKMLHSIVQGVAHCLNPLWLDQPEDEEAVSNLYDYFHLVSGGPDNVAAIAKLTRQFRVFRDCATKEMARPVARSREMRLRPVEWWLAYGHAVPELQTIALRVLSQTVSASSAERNWSIWSIVQSKRRARLLAKTLEKLVFCYTNLKLLKSIENRGMAMLEVDADTVNVEAQWMRILQAQEAWDELEVELQGAVDQFVQDDGADQADESSPSSGEEE